MHFCLLLEAFFGADISHTDDWVFGLEEENLEEVTAEM